MWLRPGGRFPISAEPPADLARLKSQLLGAGKLSHQRGLTWGKAHQMNPIVVGPAILTVDYSDEYWIHMALSRKL